MVNLSGVNEMIAKLRMVIDKFPDRVASALYIEAQIEATECKKRAPVYTGKTGKSYQPIPGVLKASIHVVGPEREGRTIWCEIVAGGLAGAYALRQHEELDWVHKVGQSKYIESVLNESRPYIASRVAKRLDLQNIEAPLITVQTE